MCGMHPNVHNGKETIMQQVIFTRIHPAQGLIIVSPQIADYVGLYF
jgi:hypothetical protein